MGLGVVELLVLFVVLPLVGLVVAAHLLGTARRAAVMDEQLARARRHQVGISVLAGAVAIITLPIGSALTPWLGQNTVLPVLPSVMVVAACLVLWVGEVTFPRPSGPVRSTVLNARSFNSVVPSGWLRACIALGALDLLIFAFGALTADGGRSLRWTEGDRARTASPYPGIDYVAPQLVVLLVAGAIAWLVCRAAITRPTIATDLKGDAVLRRASGGRVLRWLCWGLVATAAGNLLAAGSALRSAAAPESLGPVGAAFSGLGVLAVIAAIVIPFLPVPRLPRVSHHDPVGTRALRAG
jgi:hypothetical protein